MDTIPCSEGGYLTFGGAPESEAERIAETRVFSLIDQLPTTSAVTQPLPSTTPAETTIEFQSIVSGFQQKANIIRTLVANCLHLRTMGLHRC